MPSKVYVTINGECFDLEFHGKEHAANRDGALYLFRLTDLVKNRGERLLSLFRFGPDKLLLPDYDARIENVRINTIRRALDSGVVSFDSPVLDEHRYQELTLEQSDFKPQPPSSDTEIRQYIIHKAFWGCYKLRVHRAEIHDRTIVIDDSEFYMVGTSIKDIGSKLSLVNRLHEPSVIAKLRTALDSAWSAAAPLP